ncbi:MAG TPA: glycine--tRNA ligase subunit alpha [Candidatus Omnitrophica bacterium]|nr:glycine--tRNA ligase subunit alpha [Candidatus Omnitrophota bacterium]
MNFQDLVSKLEDYWKRYGCIIVYPYDIEVGAGTFHTATFLRCLDKGKWNVAYIQPTRRPTDGRYGENPLRTQFYYQYQVILKPLPKDPLGLYLESLRFLGIDIKKHDLKFVEDDWSSPTLGAAGVGWEVWLDSLEITQFTYMQQVGGIDLKEIPCEITYGIERIVMFLQNKYNLFDLKWNEDLTYGQLHKNNEKELSKYNFEDADVELYLRLFNQYEKEAQRLIECDLVIPAYECVLKISHIFNILDARGAISVTERPTFIKRVRNLASQCAKRYVDKDAKKKR